jgi:hypothetical protein
MKRICSKCTIEQSIDNFYKSKSYSTGYFSYCKSCVSIYNKNDGKIKSKEYKTRLRKEIIDKYGGKCNICNENRIEFLCIDHIDGNGNKQRKELGGTQKVWNWIKKNNYPNGYRILCHNCNQSESISKRKKDSDKNITIKRRSIYNRNKYRRYRDIVLNHYCKKCVCCNEVNENKLSIDHIHGNGKRHIKSIGSPHKLCKWIIENNFPNSFRILCHNCNFSYGHYGYCPHNKK